MNVSEFARSFEMARADLKNIVEAVDDGNLDRAASLYINKAKARGLRGINILAGLGSLLREATDLSTDEIKGLKGKVKDKLEGEEEPEEKKPPKKKKKAKKDEEGEEEEEEGDEDEDEKAGEEEGEEEEEEEPEEEKEKEREKGKKKKAKKPFPPNFPPKKGEGGMKLPESTHVRHLTLRDEILKRSGLYKDGEYIRETQEGHEGDAGPAYSVRKGKKGNKKVGRDGGFGGKPEMEISGGNKARGKASRRAEDEKEGPEDYEGLTKAMGTGEGGGSGGRDADASVQHPAKGVGYTLKTKGNEGRDQGLAYGSSDPNVGGDGISRKRGTRGVRYAANPTGVSGGRDDIDNEGLAGAPGTGDGPGDFGLAHDGTMHPNKGVSYILGNKKGNGQPTSDPNTISGMKYTGRNEEGGGSKFTVPKGKGTPPVSDPNMRNKKGWK
jgi:hypothetical protein